MGGLVSPIVVVDGKDASLVNLRRKTTPSPVRLNDF